MQMFCIYQRLRCIKSTFQIGINRMITATDSYHLCQLSYHQMTRNVPTNASEFTAASYIINAHTEECDILYRRHFYDLLLKDTSIVG